MAPGNVAVAAQVAIYLAVGLAGGDAHLRSFGFVYGAIPTAPSVLVYCHEYLARDARERARTAVSLVRAPARTSSFRSRAAGR